jgi:hypothetical protein
VPMGPPETLSREERIREVSLLEQELRREREERRRAVSLSEQQGRRDYQEELQETSLQVRELEQALNKVDPSYPWSVDDFIARLKSQALLPDEKVRLKTLTTRQKMEIVELLPVSNQTEKRKLSVYMQWGL